MGQSWSDDEELWKAIDECMRVSSQPLKEVLDRLYEYQEQVHPVAKTIIYGGLATFVSNYVKFRMNSNEPKISFGESLRAVQNHPLMIQMFSQGIENTIDEKVEGMKNE